MVQESSRDEPEQAVMASDIRIKEEYVAWPEFDEGKEAKFCSLSYWTPGQVVEWGLCLDRDLASAP
jgi:hypothetical protein